jgi:hypothetical protein
MINLVLHVKLKIALENKKRPKRSQMAKFIFRGQARKKKAKFELFGLQEANLATLRASPTSFQSSHHTARAHFYSGNFMLVICKYLRRLCGG